MVKNEHTEISQYVIHIKNQKTIYMSCLLLQSLSKNLYIKSCHLNLLLNTKWITLVKKNVSQTLGFVPLNSAGWAWALVMSSSENYSHFDGLMMCHCLGRLFKEPQLQLCFVPPPRHPFAAFVRSSIQKKKKKREALLLGFFYNLRSFQVQRSKYFFDYISMKELHLVLMIRSFPISTSALILFGLNY